MVLVTLKWCQPLSHLHVIIIEEPKGTEVIQSEMPNMWVNQITAHIQHETNLFTGEIH